MTGGPRIVVDARMATDGGIGTYLQQLVPRIAGLRPDWRFTVIGDIRKMRALHWDEIASFDLVNSRARIFSVREQIELAAIATRGADLFWSPNYDIPLLGRTPLVVTVHDVNHLALPELMGGRLRRWYARWMLTTAVRRARRVLYDSEFTRQEAIRLIGDGSSAGTVVRLGVDESWFDARAHAPEPPVAEPYFLYVGNIKRHKNVPFLLRAFERVMHRLPHRLVLIGRTGGLRADPSVSSTLERLGDRAVMLGETDARTLSSYVVHAYMLVTASLYEGFGLPALEAMAAGTPCLVSRAGSLPEICGDAALYGDPTDEEAFAARLLETATNRELRDGLVESGRRHAARFTWSRSAEQTAAVLDAALKQRTGA